MPKATAKHIALHKAAAAAVKHLKKLPAGTRRKLGNLSLAHLDYKTIGFHKKIPLPHQKHNLAKWGSSVLNPVMKC
jgi:hypothetical protein